MIRIDNENLANYIMFKLDKLDNDFTEQELDEISEVVIDYSDDENNTLLLDDLLKLKRLNIVTLRNGFIHNDDINLLLNLSYLKDISFDRCEFEDADLIVSFKIDSLSLINCNINNYDFISDMNYLKQLTIINGTIEINRINLLKDLNYLQLSYSNIKDNNDINISTLNELYIDNTNISNFNFINNLSNLKKLSIDDNQYNMNKDLFNSLINRNIIVLDENMVEFEV